MKISISFDRWIRLGRLVGAWVYRRYALARYREADAKIRAWGLAQLVSEYDRPRDYSASGGLGWTSSGYIQVAGQSVAMTMEEQRVYYQAKWNLGRVQVHELTPDQVVVRTFLDEQYYYDDFRVEYEWETTIKAKDFSVFRHFTFREVLRAAGVSQSLASGEAPPR